MPLEAKVFRASNTVRYPNLPDIMRLRARRVIIDDILNRQRKHLSARVAGEGRRLVRGQDNHDGPDDVADGIGRYPAVVVGLVLVIVVAVPVGLDQLLLPAAARLAGLLVVFGAIRSGALPLLGLFVALEGQRLDHGNGAANGNNGEAMRCGLRRGCENWKGVRPGRDAPY